MTHTGGVRILIAEDDRVSRLLLTALLEKWGYEPVVACDGTEAWNAMQAPDAPALAILDWMMPGLAGPELCRRLRAAERPPLYLIMLTARERSEDIVEALDSGADDYVVKPFDPPELHARVRVGLRVLDLHNRLADRCRELQKALSEVKQLQGLIPICSYCKRVRTDRNYWQQVEAYLAEHAAAQFTHSICPDCFQRVVQDLPQR